MDITNFLATIKRMKLLTDVLLTNNQRFLERYTQYHLIEAPNDRDLEYMDEIPPEKSKCTSNAIKSQNHTVNVKMQDFMSGCSKMDKKLITQISSDIIIDESIDYIRPPMINPTLVKSSYLKVSYLVEFISLFTIWFILPSFQKVKPKQV